MAIPEQIALMAGSLTDLESPESTMAPLEMPTNQVRSATVSRPFVTKAAILLTIALLGFASVVQFHADNTVQTSNVKGITGLDVTLELLWEPKVAVVIKLFKMWGKGNFTGEACLSNANALFTESFILDARNPLVTKTAIHKRFTGSLGFCAWVRALLVYDLKDYRPVTMYPLGDDKVVVATTYTPALVAGKKADHKTHDMEIYTFEGGKISKLEYFLGEPKVVDALFGYKVNDAKLTGNILSTVHLFKKWGAGNFSGKDCESHTPSAFLQNVRVDARNPLMKNTDIYKLYTGINGLCAWINAIGVMDFQDYHPVAMYPFGDDKVVMSASWTPGLLGGDKADHKAHDFQIITFKNGKVSEFGYFMGEPLTIDALFELPSANVAAVMEMFKEWGEGKFSGKSCESNAAAEYTDSVIVDARNPLVKNTDMYKQYRGIKGFCDWGHALEIYDLKDYQPVAIYPFHADRVIMTANYTPALKNGKKADHKAHDMMIYTFTNGKFAEMDYFMGEPKTTDALFGKVEVGKPTGNVAIVIKLFKQWGEGKFNGTACESNAASAFLDNVVIDASNPLIKNTDIYRVYRGIKGVCGWMSAIQVFDLRDYKPFAMYPWGDNKVVVTAQYTPGLVGGRKAGRKAHDIQIFTIKDGKVSDIEYFMGDPLTIDALFDKPSVNVATAMEVFYRWGNFSGDACESIAASLGDFTDDIIVDARNPTVKNTVGIYKLYPKGIKGFCAWVHALKVFDLKDYRPVALYPLGDDRVVMASHSTPTLVGGKKADHKTHDMIIFSFKNGRISRMNYLLGEPQTVDALFGTVVAAKPTGNVPTVIQMFQMWAAGNFSGKACESNSASAFLPNVVMDARNPLMKNSHIYKVYTGLKGLCAWMSAIQVFDLTDYKAVAMYPLGDDKVVVATSYTPGLIGGEKADHKANDMEIFTFQDGKVAKMEYLMGDPQTIDQLFTEVLWK